MKKELVNIYKISKADILKMVIAVGLASLFIFMNVIALKQQLQIENRIEDLNCQMEAADRYINILENEIEKLKRDAGKTEDVSRGEIRKTLIGTFEATAYTDDVESQGKWVGQTAIGIKPEVGIVAVDPKVIPLGSKLLVEGYNEGKIAIAGDTGGAIKGNRIDVFLASKSECMEYGRQNVRVWLIK